MYFFSLLYLIIDEETKTKTKSKHYQILPKLKETTEANFS